MGSGEKIPLADETPRIGLLMLVRGCVTDFSFYRRLIDRPVGSSFKTLAILVAAVTLVVGGRDVYLFNQRYLGRIYSILEGRLSHIVIRDGQVEMDGDYFLLEDENSYPVWALKRLVSRDRVTPEEIGVAALEWLEDNYPDPGREVTPSELARKIEESPGLEPAAADYLRRESDFGRFVFKVDLTGAEPLFPPRTEGFILTRDKIHYRPIADFRDHTEGEDKGPARLPLTTTMELERIAGDRPHRLDNETLDRWRRLAGLVLSPLSLAWFYVRYFISRLLQALLGCAVAALACSGGPRLAFPKKFSLAVHAMIPAVILGTIESLLPGNLPFFIMIFLVVYFFYVWKAARAVCVQG